MPYLTTRFPLESGSGKHDYQELYQALDTLPGVQTVTISKRGRLAVDYDPAHIRRAEILSAVRQLGFQPQID